MRFLASVFLLFFVMAGPAAAHRLPLSATTIEESDDGKTVLITHRLHAHDAVELLLRLSPREEPVLDDLKSQARVALELSKSFRLSADKKSSLELTIIGAEIEDEFLFVYMEMPYPEQPLFLKSTMLRQLGPDWINHVNVEQNGTVSSVTFMGRMGWQRLPLR